MNQQFIARTAIIHLTTIYQMEWLLEGPGLKKSRIDTLNEI